MALNIKHLVIDKLARELARLRGERISDAVLSAIREQLKRERAKTKVPDLARELMEIGRRFSSLPVLDERSADEILGYDKDGLPT
jgi:antitoxin VapB